MGHRKRGNENEKQTTILEKFYKMKFKLGTNKTFCMRDCKIVCLHVHKMLIFTFQTCGSEMQLVAIVADAFEIAFVAVDVRDRESNEYPYEALSQECLFVMTFLLVDF